MDNRTIAECLNATGKTRQLPAVSAEESPTVTRSSHLAAIDDRRQQKPNLQPVLKECNVITQINLKKAFGDNRLRFRRCLAYCRSICKARQHQWSGLRMRPLSAVVSRKNSHLATQQDKFIALAILSSGCFVRFAKRFCRARVLLLG